MAISSFTDNFALVAEKINEKSINNGWGISAESNYVDGITEVYYLNIKNSSGNTILRLRARNYSSIDAYGIMVYYNNGDSSNGKENLYGSGSETATVYFTSHGFILRNNAARDLSIGYVNVNDDGIIICGSNSSSSDSNLTLHANFCGMKYDEPSYQSLGFTPHTNPSGTTLCNVTAVGSLGEPQVAKYMFYAPVYQSAITGEIDIDGERYVAYGGMWYLKD